MNIAIRTVFLLMVLWALGGCNNGVEAEKMTFKRLSDIPTSKLEALSGRSYFFGHQSVGRNILDGLRMVMAENPVIKLKIVESERVVSVEPGSFMHANVGQNKHPETKIEQYHHALDSGLGNRVDAAFLKFCYMDMSEGGNPQGLFEKYRRAVQSLKAKYPKTTFVHFTLPLESMPARFKAAIKDLIGRDVPERLANIRRAEYNRLMREVYVGNEPVFDLARLESIDPATGNAYKFDVAGKQYEAMAPVNTDDGGHLSESGKRWIAEQLVVFLANLND